MTYTLLRGSFVIRYPDIPRQGPEPDGDTVRFRPDTPALVETLPRQSGRPPNITGRGISVRLEAIDALETHFAESHQELVGANAARDFLLAKLGFSNVRFFPDQVNKVQSSDQDEIRGHLLSNGIDAHGRLIAFIFAGEDVGADGSITFVDEAIVDSSVNASILKAGLAYPAFYATLPASLRKHLAVVATAARTSQPQGGFWSRSTADPNDAATVTNLGELEQLVMWPKLFRRVVTYMASGARGFDAFDEWLRADPVSRDDELFLLDSLERGNMHDVVRGQGDHIQLTMWPEKFIISPDPVPPGATTQPPRASAGDVIVVAALPDPVGHDAGRESVTLVNTTSSAIDLGGWGLLDGAGGRMSLEGSIAGGGVTQFVLEQTVKLANKGDSIILQNGEGNYIDQVAYKAGQVRSGRTICFGR